MAKKLKSRKVAKRLFYARISSYILSLFILIGVYWFILPRTPSLPQPPLKDLAATHNVELGNHAILSRLNVKPYKNLLTSQFSLLTIDGEAHWSDLRPTATTYDFAKSDKLVSFAQRNNMNVQFHHLVWGEKHVIPDWLKNGHYSQQQLLNIMHDDISQVVGHYKGQVAEWSVVNEAFTRAEHQYNLRDWWADQLGGYNSYIDDSFIWAHQADPQAVLILNDFHNEVANSVSNAEYNYIKAAKSRGVPITGYGMQMHINAASPPNKADIIKNIQRFAALGVKTYVTEFDVNVNTVKGSGAYKSQLEAQITHDMARACTESKSCVSFNTFGMTDKENLLKKLFNTDSHSFLFDSHYRPKASFYSFRQAWLEE